MVVHIFKAPHLAVGLRVFYDDPEHVSCAHVVEDALVHAAVVVATQPTVLHYLVTDIHSHVNPIYSYKLICNRRHVASFQMM